MDASDRLAERFETHRRRLRAIGYRMLGSVADADDAVQEAWLRLARTEAVDPDGIDDLGAWLTTVTARVCLNLLRARGTRGELPLETHVPDPIVDVGAGAGDPEHEALVADAVGLALLVVLDTLTPTERLAVVLHDAFGVPFTEIAEVAETTPDAVRQAASRGRRRVQAADPTPDRDLARQREALAAFLAAARDGDFDALVAVLHPDAVLRSDGGIGRASATQVLRGAARIARGAVGFADGAPHAHPVLVNGAAGVVVGRPGRPPIAVMACTVRGGLIVEIDVLADPARIASLGITLPAGD